MLKSTVATLLAVLTLSAYSCGSPDLGPVETVKSTKFSLQYPPEWWRDAARQEADAFKKARDFCEKHALNSGGFDSTRYPNCEHLTSAVRQQNAREAARDTPSFESFGPDIAQ